MCPKPSPQVPSGNTGILAGVSENFAFHSSPEAFLVARILQHHKEHPHKVHERVPVQAKILNRNIIVFSSYRQVQEVLCSNRSESSSHDASPFDAMPAYRQLMQDFFPPPNLLLADGGTHQRMQVPWKRCIHSMETADMFERMRKETSEFLQQIPKGSQIDLYEKLKLLSWKLFLSSFIDFSDADPDFNRFVKLQEDLLRGQFSLFPASVNFGFWHSPRKIGVDARKALQSLIAKKMEQNKPSWISGNQIHKDEAINHILMATSSLAVKGFASLTLALLLHLFLFPHSASGSASLADWIMQGDTNMRRSRTEAMLKETLRLSPPVVGVLRRANQDCTIETSSEEEPDVLIPKGYEAWSYFPGANRDPTIFGDDADLFRPERYLDEGRDVPNPIAFGVGPKSCLGADFVSKAALTVVNVLLDSNLDYLGVVDATGVKAWLGHEIASPEEWAQDVKQLPVQRPSRPVMVQISHRWSA